MPKKIKIRIKTKFKTLSFYCITLALICQAFGLIFWPGSAQAVTSSTTKTYSSNFRDNLYFEDFTADYYLSKASDGTSRLKVVEEFTAVFDKPYKSHGITRVIPYTNQKGENLTTESDTHLDVKVWHNGIEEQPYKVEASSEGYFRVFIGDPDKHVGDTQHYRLEYEFRNVITAFTEDGRSWQELYWDTNGNDWSQRFGQVTARVHFSDSEIAQAYQDQSWCYVGSYGDTGEDRCTSKTLSDGMEFTTEDVRGYENLTFVLEFAPNTFVVPGKRQSFLYIGMAAVGLAIISFLAFKLNQARHKIDEKRKFYDGYFVKAEYTPPQGFTVGEMSENYFGKAIMGSSKVATLMELAVQHKIELVQLPPENKIGRKKPGWKVIIRSIDLSPEETIILKILNGKRDNLSIGQEIVIEKHSPTQTLINLGKSYTTKIQKSNLKKGLLETKINPKTNEPEVAKNPCNSIIGWAVFLGFISFMICMIILTGEKNSYTEIIGGTGFIVVAIILYVIGIIWIIVRASTYANIYERTPKGLEYARYLDGLKLYIGMAEKERIQFLQSVDGADVSNQGIVKLYEKLLPYAMIFKMEKSWLNEMSRYYEYSDVGQPNWYIGIGAFSAADFTEALSSATTYISSTTTHSTTSNSSSGSSGGGGGGFSGGGGGGGGGGSW